MTSVSALRFHRIASTGAGFPRGHAQCGRYGNGGHDQPRDDLSFLPASRPVLAIECEAIVPASNVFDLGQTADVHVCDRERFHQFHKLFHSVEPPRAHHGEEVGAGTNHAFRKSTEARTHPFQIVNAGETAA